MKRIYIGILASLCLLVSAQAADFKWMDDKGELYNLSEAYNGQPVVVHFWASWCPPCVAEMPEMSAWLEEHPEVKFLPVSLDRNLAAAQNFLQQNNIPLPTLLTDNSQSGRMGVRGLPTTILIDQHGKVLSSHIGMQDWQNTLWTNQLLALFPSRHLQKTATPVEIAHTKHN
ncbi:MAG: thiol:disulfide interchange protein [Proteobacteria bacterium]|nr:MAG: thiol:disulfide interchange protein [Pseudomonadota bacterium]